MANKTSTSIIYIYIHGTAATVLSSGHPPETRSSVSKSGHSPGIQKHDIVGKAGKPFGTAAMETVEKQ